MMSIGTHTMAHVTLVGYRGIHLAVEAILAPQNLISALH